MQIIALLAFPVFCVKVAILSGLVGLVFGIVTAIFIKGVGWRRRLVMCATSALPFVFMALVVFPFILLRFETEKMSVPGSCGLPNGYSLMVIDKTSPAWVYRQRDESGRASVDWQKDGVDGVTSLQVADRYILGGRDSHALAPTAKAGRQADSYFALDTKTGKLITITSFAELQNAASQLGIQLKLERAYAVYSNYGPMQFARVPPYGTLLASVVLVWLLVRWALQLRGFQSARSAGLVTEVRV